MNIVRMYVFFILMGALTIGLMMIISNQPVNHKHFSQLKEEANIIQQRNMSNIERDLNNNFQYFVKVLGHNVYMFSAIVTLQRDRLIISAWEHRTVIYESIKCCYMYNNGNILNFPSLEKMHKQFSTAALGIRPYICPFNSSLYEIVRVTITFDFTACPSDQTSYVKLIFPKPEGDSSIAICTKAVYGSPNLLSLIEWFETQRFLGVDKVSLHLHIPDISTQSIPVFKYYEDIGLAVVIPFHIPMRDTVPRTLKDKTLQGWADGRLCLRDCELRLSGFRYLSILDLDEIILPNTTVEHGALKKFLEAELGRRPELAGTTFMTQLHLTYWEEKDSSKEQYFSNFKKCSSPVYDRPKPVVMLDRIEPLSLYTHGFKPRTGFRGAYARPAKVTLHHYRSPRSSYTGVNGSLEPTGSCDRMITLASKVREEVIKVAQLLKINLTLTSP